MLFLNHLPSQENEPGGEDEDQDEPQPEESNEEEAHKSPDIYADRHDMHREPLHSPSTVKPPKEKRKWMLRPSYSRIGEIDESKTLPVNRQLFPDHGDDQTGEDGGAVAAPEDEAEETSDVPPDQLENPDENNGDDDADEQKEQGESEATEEDPETDLKEGGPSKGTFKDYTLKLWHFQFKIVPRAL